MLHLGDSLVKTSDISQMLAQKPTPKAPAIGRFHDVLKEFGKRRRNSLYAMIVWVVQDRIIQVKYALLLWARNGIVGRSVGFPGSIGPRACWNDRRRFRLFWNQSRHSRS